MPLDFPSSPSPNQIYTYGSRSWIWNGVAWDSYAVSSGNVTSVNGLTGELGLSGGNSISINSSGNTLVVSYTGTGSSFNDVVTSFNGKTGSVGISAGYSKGEGITWGMVGNTYAFGVHYTTAVGASYSSVNDFDVLLLERKTSGQMYRIYAKDFAANMPYPAISDAGDPTASTDFLISGNQFITYNNLSSTILKDAVTSVNGSTGDITSVSKFNGLTGDVQGVSSISGTTSQIFLSGSTGNVVISFPNGVTMPGDLVVTGNLNILGYLLVDGVIVTKTGFQGFTGNATQEFVDYVDMDGGEF